MSTHTHTLVALAMDAAHAAHAPLALSSSTPHPTIIGDCLTPRTCTLTFPHLPASRLRLLVHTCRSRDPIFLIRGDHCGHPHGTPSSSIHLINYFPPSSSIIEHWTTRTLHHSTYIYPNFFYY
ncbi:hypothetical protein K466DRAFT_228823 [Polyporus arcularius HHB13444]|uniref:Uncharacterized protein n=1 Tax=Polyporus arcularius HHB13444 TaxID=1314778 RepID=A0A5C3P639_9APHY|nr:hypothetical protein K466DRAFT_228823 [Polyporus arcularius HHB13444]